MQCCSLQHLTLLLPPDSSTTEHRFCFDPASTSFLELFLCSSPVAYWTLTNLGGGSHSRVISFCLFILFMGFSRQEYWSGLTFPSPGDLPHPRIKPGSPALQLVSWIVGRFFLPTEPAGKPSVYVCVCVRLYTCVYIYTHTHIYTFICIHMQCGLRDLSSPNRDWTWAVAVKAWHPDR